MFSGIKCRMAKKINSLILSKSLLHILLKPSLCGTCSALHPPSATGPHRRTTAAPRCAQEREKC